MRTNLRFITCLLWLFTFTSVAADTKQHQHVVSQQQSETIYGQIFAMQNRLAQLEAGLQQQQHHTSDLKNAEKELQQLNVQLARLELQLSSQKEVQSNELTAVSTRVSDVQTNMSWWLSMVGLFLTLLTLMLAFVGFLTYQRSKDAALQQIQDFLKTEKPLLLEEAKTDILKDAELEIELVRRQLTHDFTQKWEEFFEPLQNQAEHFFNRKKLNNTVHSENELSDEQKRQLAFATTLKPESEFTAKDWYNRSTSELANGNYPAALNSIEHALADKKQLTQIAYANFLFRKAICLTSLDQSQQAVATYNELIEEFTDSTDIKLQEVVATAMFNKGFRLGKLSELPEEIKTYDSLLERFADSTHSTIQELVASALIGRGVCLARQHKSKEAIDVYDEVILKFDGSKEPELQKLVANALANQSESSLLIESPAKALQRIAATENKSNDRQILAVMLFFRFILDDQSISSLFDTLKDLPEGTALTWSFNEIKPYIEDKFHSKKLSQCNAIIKFFEQHKDIKTLEAELDEIG